MKLSTAVALAVTTISLGACARPAPHPAGAEAIAAEPAQAAPAVVKEPVAAPGSADARALAAIHAVAPGVVVDRISAAPMPGFRQLIVSGQTVYVSDDGRYMLQGNLFDAQAHRDLSAQAMGAMRKELLAQVPQSQRIVFAPPNPKYTVAVFTDINCGFCRKLHSDIAQYNAQGIAVEYLAFPREGLGSEDARQMEAVWCSADRRKALTDAKNGNPVPYRRCTNPVAMEYALGERLGLQGTPMIIAPNGVSTPGYMPPAALRQWLDRQMAQP